MADHPPDRLPALVLHLDVNKTLIQVDPASGATVADVCAGMVAENAWGIVAPAPAPAPGAAPAWTWTLASDVLAVDAPDGLGAPTSQQHCSSTITATVYDSFLKNVAYPYVRDAPRGTPLAAQVLADNAAKKAAVRALVQRCTAPGAPGEAFAGVHAALTGALTGVLLLPAYFRLLERLLASGRDFVVVFRTFGHDAGRVIAEHNAWCSGTHPRHAPPAGVDATPLLVRCPHDTGSFIRFADGSAGVQLAAVVEDGDPSRVVHVTGFRDIHDHLVRGLAEARSSRERERGGGGGPHRPYRRVLALTDCYDWWWAGHERGRAGKLMPFDPADASMHHLFLDDNIGRRRDSVRLLHADHVAALLAAAAAAGATDAPSSPSSPSPPPRLHIATTSAAAGASAWTPAPGEPEVDARIVDARDVRTGAHLPFHGLRNVHLLRVDPLSASLNPQYFVECVALAERNRAALLAAAAAAEAPPATAADATTSCGKDGAGGV